MCSSDSGCESVHSRDDSNDDTYEPGIKGKGKGKAKAVRTSKGKSNNTRKVTLKATVISLANDETPSANDIDNNKDIDQSAIGRIRKALALANHKGTSEGEAKAALRMAHKLMAQQNVKMADIVDKENKEERASRAGMSVVQVCSLATGNKPSYQQWFGSLIYAIDHFFNVKSYNEIDESKKTLSFCFYGISDNTVAAAVAFEFVFNQILSWTADKLRLKEIKGRVAATSYKTGVADGLCDMAEEAAREELKAAKEAEQKLMREKIAKEEEQRARELERLKDLSASRVEEESDPDIKPAVKKEEEPAQTSTSATKWKPDTTHRRKIERDSLPCTGATAGSDEDDYEPAPDFDAAEAFNMDLDGALARAEMNEQAKRKPRSPPPEPKPKIYHTPPPAHRAKEEPKDEEVEEAAWKSASQLTIFRENADKIAADYIKTKGLKLKKGPKRKGTLIDWDAFKAGENDARKIDVKRKRIA